MRQTLQFLVMLLATIGMSSFGLLVQARKAETDEREILLGILVLVALPLVLWSWFRRLNSEDPPIWGDRLQQLADGSRERTPVSEVTRPNLFFPLPWFLLPLFLVFGSVGLFTEYRTLVSAPMLAAIVWMVLVGGYVMSWALRHRSVAKGGVERMLADFQLPPRQPVDSVDVWVSRIFDLHRPSMDDATLETLYRTGLADAFGSSAPWPGMEVTRLQPRYAHQGWQTILEARGLIPVDESMHRRDTTVPALMEGWQCPRCRNVNHPAARRCSLREWGTERTCGTRRPGLSRIAYLRLTTVEAAQYVVVMLLFLAPLLLVPLLFIGAVFQVGQGDPAALLAGIALTVVWLAALRSLPVSGDITDGMAFAYFVLGSFLVWPLITLAEALWPILRRVVRRARPDRST